MCHLIEVPYLGKGSRGLGVRGRRRYPWLYPYPYLYPYPNPYPKAYR